VVDVCATSLADADTYIQTTFESNTFAAAEPPALNDSLKTPPCKGFTFLEQKDPEQAGSGDRGAAPGGSRGVDGRQNAGPRREGHVAKDVVATAASTHTKAAVGVALSTTVGFAV
jgi:hypothetical protein